MKNALTMDQGISKSLETVFSMANGCQSFLSKTLFKMILNFYRLVWANSADPDQTAPKV